MFTEVICTLAKNVIPVGGIILQKQQTPAPESIIILLLPFVAEMLQQKKIGRIVATISVCGLLAGEGSWGDMNILLFTIIGVIITLLVIYTQDGLQQLRDEKPQLQDQLNIQFMGQASAEMLVGAVAIFVLRIEAKEAPNQIPAFLLFTLAGLSATVAAMTFSSNVLNRCNVLNIIGGNIAESTTNGISSWSDKITFGATYLQVLLAFLSYREMSKKESSKIKKREKKIEMSRMRREAEDQIQ
jgi:hypothetical protein